MEGINIYVYIFSVMLIIIIIIMGLALKIRSSYIKEQECRDTIMSDLLDEYRGIKHTYSNFLQRMVCFIDEQEWQGLKELKGELSELRNERILFLTSLMKIRSPRLVEALISIKASVEMKNIKFHLYVNEEIALSQYEAGRACKSLRKGAEAAAGHIEKVSFEDLFVKIFPEEQRTVILIEAGKAFNWIIKLK